MTIILWLILIAIMAREWAFRNKIYGWKKATLGICIEIPFLAISILGETSVFWGVVFRGIYAWIDRIMFAKWANIFFSLNLSTIDSRPLKTNLNVLAIIPSTQQGLYLVASNPTLAAQMQKLGARKVPPPFLIPGILLEIRLKNSEKDQKVEEFLEKVEEILPYIKRNAPPWGSLY